MTSRLYRRAYKFLELRSRGGNPMQALEELSYEDRERVKYFLDYNHQIRFI